MPDPDFEFPASGNAHLSLEGRSEPWHVRVGEFDLFLLVAPEEDLSEDYGVGPEAEIGPEGGL